MRSPRNGDALLRVRVAKSWGLLLGIGIAGIAVSAGIFFVTKNADSARVQSELEVRAGWRANQFQRGLIVAAENAEGLAIYMAAEGEVSAARFHVFAKLAHADDDFNSALYWSPLIKDSDRDAFVARMRLEVSPDYDIREIAQDDSFVTAATRTSYLPQLYEEVYDNAPGVPGFNLSFRPARRADAEHIRDTGTPLATLPFQLLMGGKRVPGFLVLWPSYGQDGVPPTVEERRTAFKGVAAARFRLDNFLLGVTDHTPTIAETIEISIGADEAHVQPVAWFDPVTKVFALEPMGSRSMDGEIVTRQTFTALAQTWVLVSHFPPAVTSALSSEQPWAAFGFCLLLTALIMVAAERERWRRTGVEAIVAERTAALAATNDALMREIEEHNAAERSAMHSAQVLARNEKQLQAVLDSTVDGIVTIDELGTILSFSKRAETIFGYRADEVIGQNVKMLMPEPYHGAHDGFLHAYLTTGISKIIGIGRQVVGRRKDDSEFPMDLGVGEIFGIEGQREFVGSVRDITDRIAAQKEFHRSEALLKATFDASPYAIVIRDNDLKILLWNPAAEQIFGYTADEVIGKSRWSEEDQVFDDQFEALSRRAALGETIGGIEEERRRKDGKLIQVRRTIAPIHIGQDITGFVGIVEDVTTRNLMERQLVHAQKMEAIGNLSGGMAHDFNNILGVIVGNLELLLPALTSKAEEAEMARDALDAALHGADLTQRLLAFSRLQPLQPQVTDLNQLVSNIARMVERVLDANIRLSLDLAADIAPVVADPVQLEASLMNLVTNARDAMPRGGLLTVRTVNWVLDKAYCSLHPEAVPGDYGLIEVSDTGTGITQEILDHIFEPFFTTKDIGKGTGLGLSMVFGFIKQSQGHINVYSEPGVGTTFRIYLPRVTSDTTAYVGHNEEDIPLGQGEIILVVEDDNRLRRAAVRQLSELGYHPVEAADAATALALLKTQKVDLVFTDIMMPGDIDGFGLARHIMESWPAIKVVLTSGFPGAKFDHDLRLLALSTRLLTKPYRQAELAMTLRMALNDNATKNTNGRI